MAVHTGTFNFGTLTPASIPCSPSNDIYARIARATESGHLSTSELATLDVMAQRDFSLAQKLMMNGYSSSDAKLVADRRARYESLADRFIRQDAPQAIAGDDAIRAVSFRDLQLAGRQSSATATGISNGSISRGEFQQLNAYANRTEELRGLWKGGGYTLKERQVIESRQKTYDQMLARFGVEDKVQAKPNDPADRLYDAAKWYGSTSNNPCADGNSLRSVGSPNPVGTELLTKSREHAYATALVQGQGRIESFEREMVREATAQPGRRMQESPAPQPVDPSRLKRFKNLFGSLDTNRDGSLTKGELIRALGDPRYKGEDAKALAVAAQDFGQLSGRDSENQPRTIKLSRLNEPGFANGFSSSFDRMKDIQTGPQTLYGDKAGPDLGSVRQGSEGDCWILSTVTAMKPEQVQRLLSAQKDGNFTLQLPGRPPETVAPLTEGERYFYSSSNGNWSGILEKGMRQILEREAQAKCISTEHHSVTDGGWTGRAVEMLTGKGSTDIQLNDRFNGDRLRNHVVVEDPRKLDALLRDAFTTGKPVTAGSSQGTIDQPGSRLSINNHAFAVVGYDSKTQIVTVRNPWGKDEAADLDCLNDGLFRMPLKQFQTNFSMINIGNQPHAPLPLYAEGF